MPLPYEMKQQQRCLALCLWLSVVTDGIAVSATARAKSKTLRTAREVMFNKLDRVERLAKTEIKDLQSQQRMFIALEEKQEALEAREKTLDVSERMTGFEQFVIEKGTISSGGGPSVVVRQSIPAEQIRVVSGGSSAPGQLVVLLRGMEKEFWARSNDAFYQKLVGLLMYLLQISIFALLYVNCCKHTAVRKVRDSQVKTISFQFGAFDANDIGRDWQMCFCAFCCPWIRWADTASAPQVQFLSFVPALFITAALASASGITFGASLPLLFLVTVLCRQRIRQTYGLPSGTCQIVCFDCLLWVCCPFCAVVQEARQIEYVDVPAKQDARIWV